MAEKLNEIKTKVKQAAVQKKKAVKNAVFKIKGGGNTVTSNKLVTLITVVNRNKAEYYAVV